MRIKINIPKTSPYYIGAREMMLGYKPETRWGNFKSGFSKLREKKGNAWEPKPNQTNFRKATTMAAERGAIFLLAQEASKNPSFFQELRSLIENGATHVIVERVGEEIQFFAIKTEISKSPVAQFNHGNIVNLEELLKHVRPPFNQALQSEEIITQENEATKQETHPPTTPATQQNPSPVVREKIRYITRRAKSQPKQKPKIIYRTRPTQTTAAPVITVSPIIRTNVSPRIINRIINNTAASSGKSRIRIRNSKKTNQKLVKRKTMVQRAGKINERRKPIVRKQVSPRTIKKSTPQRKTIVTKKIGAQKKPRQLKPIINKRQQKPRLVLRKKNTQTKPRTMPPRKQIQQPRVPAGVTRILSKTTNKPESPPIKKQVRLLGESIIIHEEKNDAPKGKPVKLKIFQRTISRQNIYSINLTPIQKSLNTPEKEPLRTRVTIRMREPRRDGKPDIINLIVNDEFAKKIQAMWTRGTI